MKGDKNKNSGNSEPSNNGSSPESTDATGTNSSDPPAREGIHLEVQTPQNASQNFSPLTFLDNASSIVTSVRDAYQHLQQNHPTSGTNGSASQIQPEFIPFQVPPRGNSTSGVRSGTSITGLPGGSTQIIFQRNAPMARSVGYLPNTEPAEFFQTITVQPQYEDKSLEELRYEAYQQGAGITHGAANQGGPTTQLPPESLSVTPGFSFGSNGNGPAIIVGSPSHSSSSNLPSFGSDFGRAPSTNSISCGIPIFSSGTPNPNNASSGFTFGGATSGFASPPPASNTHTLNSFGNPKPSNAPGGLTFGGTTSGCVSPPPASNTHTLNSFGNPKPSNAPGGLTFGGTTSGFASPPPASNTPAFGFGAPNPSNAPGGLTYGGPTSDFASPPPASNTHTFCSGAPNPSNAFGTSFFTSLPPASNTATFSFGTQNSNNATGGATSGFALPSAPIMFGAASPPSSVSGRNSFALFGGNGPSSNASGSTGSSVFGGSGPPSSAFGNNPPLFGSVFGGSSPQINASSRSANFQLNDLLYGCTANPPPAGLFYSGVSTPSLGGGIFNGSSSAPAGIFSGSTPASVGTIFGSGGGSSTTYFPTGPPSGAGGSASQSPFLRLMMIHDLKTRAESMRIERDNLLMRIALLESTGKPPQGDGDGHNNRK